MRGARIAVASLLAYGGLGVAGAAIVHAAGETVTSTVKVSPSKPKIGESGKPAPIAFGFQVNIAGPGGAREAALKTVVAKFPAGVSMDAKKFQICSLTTLKANKPELCPAKSIIGHHHSTGNATPLFKDLLNSVGNMYVTGKSKTGLTWATYVTAKEVSTLHAVLPGTLKLTGGRVTFTFEEPRLPTAPGMADATVPEADFHLDAKGSDRKPVLRATQACARGWTLPISVSFWDGSSATSTAKAGC